MAAEAARICNSFPKAAYKRVKLITNQPCEGYLRRMSEKQTECRRDATAMPLQGLIPSGESYEHTNHK
jgi:hypothetical protein